MTERFAAVLMGSDSDLPVMRTTFEVFDRLGVAYEVRIASAHRTPDATRAYVHSAVERGCAVFIAAAGLAAHLAGAVAAETVRPVIGVPIDAGPLKGLDALLSTVQMPAGVPVATVAIGRAGARNAAWLAAQILAVDDRCVAERLIEERAAAREAVVASNAEIADKLAVR